MESKNRTTYTILGVMSGTSVDGIDFAVAEFSKERHWKFEILSSKTVPYPKLWQQRLRAAVAYDKEELKLLDEEYTRYLASAIKEYLGSENDKQLDAIASHGHTILHRPDHGVTYQIGNRKELAELTGHLVVCDFRVQDVELGGQGAPLVPVGDDLLFGNYNACLNIGGFANISYNKDGKRLAFDICPTNIVLNHYADKLGFDYDKDGHIASKGTIDQKLVKVLNNLPFYTEKSPKSLGLEWVQKEILPRIEKSNLTAEAIIATFTEHMAVQISQVLLHISQEVPEYNVLVTGGGAYNKYLIKRIKDLTSLDIVVPDPKIVEFKEALVFAFMGALRLRNTTNVLKSVTGAERDHCSGVIFTP
ncbi:MAG: anhydro-N-acetylmuramic acid kinase [Leeuwenhoekiella sp.]